MTKSNFKIISYDIISVTSSQLRHRNRHNHKFFHFESLFRDSPIQNFWLRYCLSVFFFPRPVSEEDHFIITTLF